MTFPEIPPSDEVQAATDMAREEAKQAEQVIHDILEAAASWPEGYQAWIADRLTRAGKVLTYCAYRRVAE